MALLVLGGSKLNGSSLGSDPLTGVYDPHVHSWYFFVPDEVPLGESTTLYVEYGGADGSRPLLDAAPAARVLGTAAGVDVVYLGPTTMTPAGNSWSVTYAPSARGPQVLEVIGGYGGGTVMGTCSLTVRPRFDPMALALSDVLVSRM